MFAQHKFDSYLKTIEPLVINFERNPTSIQEIIDTIDSFRDKSQEEPYAETIFRGETAFFEKKYDIALQCYLHAPKTPFCRFLCYRANAYMTARLGDKEKALQDIQKALELYPKDYLSLLLYKDLLNRETHHEEVVAVQLQLEALEKGVTSPVSATTAQNTDSAEQEREDAAIALKKSNKEFLLLVQTVHEELLEKLDYTQIHSLQTDQIALHLYLLEQIEKKIVNMKLAQRLDEKSQPLALAVFDEVMGFGPIEPLLRDTTVTDIFINGPEDIYIERKGRVEKTSFIFLSHEHIFRLVQRVASKAGRHLDLSTPYFDAQLNDGTRIHAIIPPLAIDGIKVSLRKYQFQKLHIGHLVDTGSITDKMSEFLQIAVKSRFNIAICGGTGSGKTTLLNALCASIGQGERILTIEDTPELEPSHPHTVRLLTRQANPEGKGAVTQADLMINALRMRPDRVILGELRGSEAFNLLHAMNTGQDGSMVTLHASGSEEVVARLVNMILMSRYALTADSVRQQIATALDLIIYVSRLINGSRRVMTISQVSNDEKGDIKIEDVFRYDIEEITEKELQGQFVYLNPQPTKRNLNKMVVAGLISKYKKIFQS